MSDDAQEEGPIEGSAIEASTGTRFRFKGHYLVSRGTGHFAVWVEHTEGEHGTGLNGTLQIDGEDARAEILARIEQTISTWRAPALRPRTHRGMPVEREYFHFWIIDEPSGMRRLSSFRMTREEAAKRYPGGAEPLEGTREVP